MYGFIYAKIMPTFAIVPCTDKKNKFIIEKLTILFFFCNLYVLEFSNYFSDTDGRHASLKLFQIPIYHHYLIVVPYCITFPHVSQWKTQSLDPEI